MPIQTLKGRLALRIPPETQNGRTFGWPPGDAESRRQRVWRLFAKVRVVLPTSLSPEERELFAKLRDRRPEATAT